MGGKTMINRKLSEIEWLPKGSFVKYTVSKPMVMKSAAGFYVGQVCVEDGDPVDWIQPYDRMSDYFATPEVAESYLKAWLTLEENENGSPVYVGGM
jgi:hypothetical protein